MPNIITDTHALIWYLQDDARLSATASQYFDQCEHDGGHISVPSICLVEIIYLSEKGRIPDAPTLFLSSITTSPFAWRHSCAFS